MNILGYTVIWLILACKESDNLVCYFWNKGLSPLQLMKGEDQVRGNPLVCEAQVQVKKGTVPCISPSLTIFVTQHMSQVWLSKTCSLFLTNSLSPLECMVPEEVRQGLNCALRHALVCTINCVLLAITHAYKCSWQLKPRFSRYFAGGSEGLSHSKGLLFEGKNHGPKDRAARVYR